MDSEAERIEQLRLRAESEFARSSAPEELLVDARALVHDLRVHQIELQLQNDELLETQLELQESRDLYQALFDEAPVGYLILNAAGWISQANQTALTLLGVERRVLVDRRLQVFALESHIQKLNQHLERTFADAEPEALEITLRRGDASAIHVRLSSRSVRGGPPDSPQCRTTLTDVTDQKQAEDALAERSQKLVESMEAAQLLERQLVEAKRLEAIGRLSGGVAHNFNNMLTIINGAAEVALSHSPQDPAIRRNLERILVAGERSARLTSQLLAIGRRQLLSEARLCLGTLVQETCTLLGSTLGPSVRVRFTPPAERVFAAVDPGGLQQALVNLALNARDAMPEGGTVELSLDRLEVGAEDASPHAAGPYAVISVGDAGVGLDPETRERIFEPFFSTKAGRTGLGLATVHGFVAQSGGFVAVDSAPMRGTTFRIHLPAVDTAHEEPADPSSGAPPSPAQAGAVLLVEDEHVLRVLCSELIAAAGFDVVAAGSGEEALRLCQERAQPFDVAVLDVLMPGMSGVELAERLSVVLPTCQVVFISGFAQEHLLERIGRELEGVLVPKPFSPAQLVQAIQGALGR